MENPHAEKWNFHKYHIYIKWIFHFFNKWIIHYLTKNGKSIFQKMEFPQMFGKWKYHFCETNGKAIADSKMIYTFCLSKQRIHLSPENGISTFCSRATLVYVLRTESPFSVPQMEIPSLSWIGYALCVT